MLRSHPARVGEPEALPRVAREDDEEEQREIEEVPVHVLEDQRQLLLTAIAVARLTDGTAGGIGPERLVVRAAVVVASEAKAGGKWQDQQCRRDGGDPP